MVLIKTHRDALLAPLQSVSGIVEKRHTLPILSNVLLEKKGEQLTLLANLKMILKFVKKFVNDGDMKKSLLRTKHQCNG